MGKKSRLKNLGEKYKERIKKLKEEIDKGTIIDEDDKMVFRVISAKRIEVTPKNDLSLEELQIMFIKRMDTPKYRRFYNSFNIWIDNDKKVLVLSR